jgi:hypothetical protein
VFFHSSIRLYQVQKQVSGLTALAGLPTYLDLAQASGLREAICRHLTIRAGSQQGWSDHQVVMALILLNLAGQVRERSRQLQILVSAKQPAYALLLQMRERILTLARGGPPIRAPAG